MLQSTLTPPPHTTHSISTGQEGLQGEELCRASLNFDQAIGGGGDYSFLPYSRHSAILLLHAKVGLLLPHALICLRGSRFWCKKSLEIDSHHHYKNSYKGTVQTQHPTTYAADVRGELRLPAEASVLCSWALLVLCPLIQLAWTLDLCILTTMSSFQVLNFFKTLAFLGLDCCLSSMVRFGAFVFLRPQLIFQFFQEMLYEPLYQLKMTPTPCFQSLYLVLVVCKLSFWAL